MQKVSTNPAARHKTRTFTNSLVRYLMLSYVPHFLCDEATNNPTNPSSVPINRGQVSGNGLGLAKEARAANTGRAARDRRTAATH